MNCNARARREAVENGGVRGELTNCASFRLFLDAKQAKPASAMRSQLTRYADDVRHITRRQISLAEGGGTERNLWVNG
jgi:hypothetical protein